MIALISDLHGNYDALKAVLRELDGLGVVDILCLGDVAGYYTEVNECCEELRRRKVKTVMGNHDWYLVAGSFCPRSKSVNDCLKHQRKVITRANLEWLRRLPLFLKIGGLFLVHGGWTNPLDEYLEPTGEYFERVEGRFFASGHVHQQILRRFGHKVYCNPGSVGQPRDNDPRAAFAVFDGREFSLHRVEYDIERVGRLMERAGFSGYYYGCLKTGAPSLGWAEGEGPGEA
jgi:predicted phosphodiesterase